VKIEKKKRKGVGFICDFEESLKIVALSFREREECLNPLSSPTTGFLPPQLDFRLFPESICRYPAIGWPSACRRWNRFIPDSQAQRTY
jgi:hypothetical protein